METRSMGSPSAAPVERRARTFTELLLRLIALFASLNWHLVAIALEFEAYRASARKSCSRQEELT